MHISDIKRRRQRNNWTKRWVIEQHWLPLHKIISKLILTMYNYFMSLVRWLERSVERSVERSFERSFDELFERSLNQSLTMIHLYRRMCWLLPHSCVCCLVGSVVRTLEPLSACRCAAWAKFSIFSTYVRMYKIYYKNKLIRANSMSMTSNEYELEWYP